MQIQAKADRDVGKRILCNGQFYVVAPGGALCREGETEPADLDTGTAEKLLQNARAWEAYGTPRARAPQLRPKHKVQLFDRRGEVVPVEAPEQPPPAAELEPEQPPLAANLEPEQPPPAVELELEQSTIPPILPGEPAEPSPDAREMEVSPSPGEVSGRDPPIPSEGGEWADPLPTYSLEWLRACAKAYRISYGPRTKPDVLCQRIMAAMYGGEGKGNDASA